MHKRNKNVFYVRRIVMSGQVNIQMYFRHCLLHPLLRASGRHVVIKVISLKYSIVSRGTGQPRKIGMSIIVSSAKRTEMVEWDPYHPFYAEKSKAENYCKARLIDSIFFKLPWNEEIKRYVVINVPLMRCLPSFTVLFGDLRGKSTFSDTFLRASTRSVSKFPDGRIHIRNDTENAVAVCKLTPIGLAITY